MHRQHTNKARVCLQCGVTFEANSPAEIRRGGAKYCTRDCFFDARRGQPYKTLAEKFWPKVNIGRPVECWLWAARINEHGYGMLTLPKDGHWRQIRAHRISWELAHGPIPNGMHVCHRCDNPPCVNPKHLFLGTRVLNMQDMVLKGRHRSNWPPRKGSAHWNATLTDDQVLLIRARYSAGGVSQNRLGAEFGVTQGIISSIVTRRSWTHLS